MYQLFNLMCFVSAIQIENQPDGLVFGVRNTDDDDEYSSMRAAAAVDGPSREVPEPGGRVLVEADGTDGPSREVPEHTFSADGAGSVFVEVSDAGEEVAHFAPEAGGRRRAPANWAPPKSKRASFVEEGRPLGDRRRAPVNWKQLHAGAAYDKLEREMTDPRAADAAGASFAEQDDEEDEEGAGDLGGGVADSEASFAEQDEDASAGDLDGGVADSDASFVEEEEEESAGDGRGGHRVKARANTEFRNENTHEARAAADRKWNKDHHSNNGAYSHGMLKSSTRGRQDPSSETRALGAKRRAVAAKRAHRPIYHK